MKLIVERERCTGCSACAAACPKGCITLRADGEGFLYPETDAAACVDCDRCVAICPALHLRPQTGTAPEAYGVRARDDGLRLASSSGGVFTLLARRVLRSGGAVFGAELTEDCRSVRHAMAEDEDGLGRLRGSKYVQSEMGDTFQVVRAELERGREVLFTGAPCQIDGLRAFLGQGYGGLLCAEVICHGVPSPLLWKSYLDHLERGSKASVKGVSFRDKQDGWKHYGVRVERRGRDETRHAAADDPYLRMFLRDYCLRPSCYQCPSKGVDRAADLTIGDFWGVQDVAPELDDDKGTSLVLVHTKKGRRALDAVLSEAEYRRVDCAAALRGNPAVLKSAARPPQRETFYRDLTAMSFRKFKKKYVPDTGKDRLKQLLERAGLLPLAYRIAQKRRK